MGTSSRALIGPRFRKLGTNKGGKMIKFYIGLVFGLIVGTGVGLFLACLIQSTREKMRSIPYKVTFNGREI